MTPAARGHLAESAGDAASVEEDSGDEHQRGVVVDGSAQPLGERFERLLGDPHDHYPLFGQPVELPADAVKLAVGRDQPGSRTQGHGGQQSHDQLMGVRRKGQPATRVSQQPDKPIADPLRLNEGVLPLVVHVARRIEPRRRLRVEGRIGPRLVRVAGEEQPLGHPEPRVVRRERVRRIVERLWVHYSSVLIAQRSGNRGWLTVVIRYSAPALPPVPRRVPMVRCTIFT